MDKDNDNKGIETNKSLNSTNLIKLFSKQYEKLENNGQKTSYQNAVNALLQMPKKQGTIKYYCSSPERIPPDNKNHMLLIMIAAFIDFFEDEKVIAEKDFKEIIEFYDHNIDEIQEIMKYIKNGDQM